MSKFFTKTNVHRMINLIGVKNSESTVVIFVKSKKRKLELGLIRHVSYMN